MSKWTLIMGALAFIFGMKLLMVKREYQAQLFHAPMCTSARESKGQATKHFVGPEKPSCPETVGNPLPSQPKDTHYFSNQENTKQVSQQQIADQGFLPPGAVAGSDTNALPPPVPVPDGPPVPNAGGPVPGNGDQSGKDANGNTPQGPIDPNNPQPEQQAQQQNTDPNAVNPQPLAKTNEPNTSEPDSITQLPKAADPLVVGGAPLGGSSTGLLGDSGINSTSKPKSDSKKEEQKDIVEKWTQKLSDEPTYAAAREFFTAFRSGEVKADEYSKVATNMSKSSDAGSRNLGIFLISQNKNAESFGLLSQLSITDRNTAVRNYASRALLEYKDIRYISILQTKISSGTLQEKIRAAEVLVHVASYYATNKSSLPTGAAKSFAPLVAILEPMALDGAYSELQNPARSALQMIKDILKG